MEDIALPHKVHFTYDKDNEYSATVVIEPFYPGYGYTIGNSLRRVLLSSLSGAAVTHVKIKGVEHEFATIPHVKEEILQIILNLKKLRLKIHSEEPQRLVLKGKGERKLTAGDIEKNAQAEIINTDLIIATLTDPKAELEMEIVAQRGRNYRQAEERPKEGGEVGLIAVDAIFTPVVKVGYTVESARVGQRTDYDKLILHVQTDGTINVPDVFKEASRILVEHFQFLANLDDSKEDEAQK